MSFRAISTAGLAPAPLRDQALPILQWVDVDSLVIDERYQRPLGPRNLLAIQKIADEFDWMQFSPVLLAPADAGRFAVIDGQHRVHAAVLCGVTRVPAQIVMASAADQARAFAGVNSKATPITAHQVYRAALVAREPWAERCMAVVEGAGCTLATANPSAKDRKPRVLYQVGSVRKMVVQRGQADALAAVLRGIVASDMKGRVGLYTDYIISPLVNAIHGDASLTGADLAGFLRAHDPFKVLDKAAAARLEGGSVSGMQALRLALLRWMVRA
jgi:hypothetical protein